MSSWLERFEFKVFLGESSYVRQNVEKVKAGPTVWQRLLRLTATSLFAGVTELVDLVLCRFDAVVEAVRSGR